MALPALKRSRFRQWFDGDPVYKPISDRRRAKLEKMWAAEFDAATRLAAAEAGEPLPDDSSQDEGGRKRSKPKASQFVTQPQITGPRITPTGLKAPKVRLPKVKSTTLKPPKLKLP